MFKKNSTALLLTGIFALGANLTVAADDVNTTQPKAPANIQVQVQQQKTPTNNNNIPLHDEADKTDVLAIPSDSSEEDDEDMDEMDNSANQAPVTSKPAAAVAPVKK